VLRDSGARLVVTDDVLAARVDPDSAARSLPAAELFTTRGKPATMPGTARRPHEVAQRPYTSGTTGRPKGAMRGVASRDRR
jgi:long-subunit acyl-CoA synthetase (AMP-forming)